uniref:Uncharacterized protein n=1 Tax=Gallid alphaherpesvirus 2 TaxID=10390 RepID=D2Y5S5_9ALPH|nr:hypothetical protein [Gallid alphaherpesvirus 2]
MYFKPCQCDRIRFMTVDKLLKGSSPSPPSFFFSRSPNIGYNRLLTHIQPPSPTMLISLQKLYFEVCETGHFFLPSEFTTYDTVNSGGKEKNRSGTNYISE